MFSTGHAVGPMSIGMVGSSGDHVEPVRSGDASTLFLPDRSGSAVVRQSISATGRLHDLPIFARYAFDPRRLRRIAACRRLTDLDPTQVVEVASIGPSTHSLEDQTATGWSDQSLTAELLARMLRTALVEGHRIWLIAPADPLVPFLEVVAGNDTVHKVGRRRLGPRANTGPWALDPMELTNRLLDLPPGDERHWVTVTLRETLDGVRAGSPGMDRNLRSRGIRTDRPRLLGRIHLAGAATVAATVVAVLCLAAPTIHLFAYHKAPPIAPVAVIACLVIMLAIGRLLSRRRKALERRALRRILLADSVVDRVEVDRGEVQVL